ncbi:MAG: phosphoadenylyl-sulfate reductase [Chloroflexota bacterium]
MAVTDKFARLTEGAEELAAKELLARVLETFGPDRVALASSFGVEDMVLIDVLSQLTPRPRVFTLDTGRLPQETYDLMDVTAQRYGVEVEVYFPDGAEVEAMVRARGLNLFYDSVENRVECCRIRKVEPLKRALGTVDAWITGVRREQTASRVDTSKVALDGRRPGLWKIAPLVDWSEAQVWAHVHEGGVPYNTLHDRGYPSIGCAPCTRAVAPGDDPRSGRWWWEGDSDRECGLHLDMVPGRTSGSTSIGSAAGLP